MGAQHFRMLERLFVVNRRGMQMWIYLAVFGLSAGLSIGLSKLISRILLCSIISAALSTVIFQTIAYVQLGYLDPFFAIAVFFVFILAFLSSLVTLFVIRKFLNHKSKIKQ
jgi:hypothetical protein